MYTFIDVSMYQCFIHVKLNTLRASEYWKPMKRDLDIELDSGLNPSLIISPTDRIERICAFVYLYYTKLANRSYMAIDRVVHRTDRLIIASYLFYLRVCARERTPAPRTRTRRNARGHKSKFHFNVLTKDQIKHFNWRFYGGRQPKSNCCLPARRLTPLSLTSFPSLLENAYGWERADAASLCA